MPTTISTLFDPGALAIVLAGTVIATVARSGWRDAGLALQACLRLIRGGFRVEANRKALAQAVSAIQRDGYRRADPVLPPDPALALMLQTYLRHGMIDGVDRVRRTKRAVDETGRLRAVQVFVLAGELAPVFGLVGTLYGFTQLTPNADAASSTIIMTAVSTAVLTSLYGALTAHLLCLPVASAIERRSLAEEQERETLADWFIAQITGAQAAAQAQRAHLRGVA